MEKNEGRAPRNRTLSLDEDEIESLVRLIAKKEELTKGNSLENKIVCGDALITLEA